MQTLSHKVQSMKRTLQRQQDEMAQHEAVRVILLLFAFVPLALTFPFLLLLLCPFLLNLLHRLTWR